MTRFHVETVQGMGRGLTYLVAPDHTIEMDGTAFCCLDGTFVEGRHTLLAPTIEPQNMLVISSSFERNTGTHNPKEGDTSMDRKISHGHEKDTRRTRETPIAGDSVSRRCAYRATILEHVLVDPSYKGGGFSCRPREHTRPAAVVDLCVCAFPR